MYILIPKTQKITFKNIHIKIFPNFLVQYSIITRLILKPVKTLN